MPSSSLKQKSSTTFKDEAATSELGYDKEFISLIELLYGQGFLSQGGTATIDLMFEGIDFNGKKALDIGSGLGAIDFYLAKKHNVEITGVDPTAFIVESAKCSLAQLQPVLKGKVIFEHLVDPISLSQFSDGIFDYVFSKESLLHVPIKNKLPYLKEMHRVLKPGGSIVILDWMHSSPNYSAELREMLEIDGLVFYLINPKEYEVILARAGFNNIVLRDQTEEYVEFCKRDCEKIENFKTQIIEKFGESTFEYSLKSWDIQKRVFQKRELLMGILTAKK